MDKKTIKVSLKGTSAMFYEKDLKFEIKTKLIGVHQVYNLMIGYLVMKLIDNKNTATKIISDRAPSPKYSQREKK